DRRRGRARAWRSRRGAVARARDARGRRLRLRGHEAAHLGPRDDVAARRRRQDCRRPRHLEPRRDAGLAALAFGVRGRSPRFESGDFIAALRRPYRPTALLRVGVGSGCGTIATTLLPLDVPEPTVGASGNVFVSPVALSIDTAIAATRAAPPRAVTTTSTFVRSLRRSAASRPSAPKTVSSCSCWNAPISMSFDAIGLVRLPGS